MGGEAADEERLQPSVFNDTPSPARAALCKRITHIHMMGPSMELLERAAGRLQTHDMEQKCYRGNGESPCCYVGVKHLHSTFTIHISRAVNANYCTEQQAINTRPLRLQLLQFPLSFPVSPIKTPRQQPDVKLQLHRK